MARSQSSPSSLRPPPIQKRTKSSNSVVNNNHHATAGGAFDPYPAPPGFARAVSSSSLLLVNEASTTTSPTTGGGLIAPQPPQSMKDLIVREVHAVGLWMLLSGVTLVALKSVLPPDPHHHHNSWITTVSFFNPLVLVWVQSQTGVLPVWQGRLTEWRLGRLALLPGPPPSLSPRSQLPSSQRPRRRRQYPPSVLVTVLVIHAVLATALVSHALPILGSWWSSEPATSLVASTLQPLSSPHQHQQPQPQGNPSWDWLQVVVGRDLPSPKDPSVVGMAAELPLWLLSLAKDAILTALYLVLLLVLPVLLDLNRVPRWTLLILLYPLFASSGGTTSTSPSQSDPTTATVAAAAAAAVPAAWSLTLLSVAVGTHSSHSTRSWWWWYLSVSPGRLLAQAIGALIAGEIMDVYFPDDPQF